MNMLLLDRLRRAKQSGNAPSGYVPVLFLMRLCSKGAEKSRPSRLEIDGLVTQKNLPEITRHQIQDLMTDGQSHIESTDLERGGSHVQKPKLPRQHVSGI